MTSETQMCLQAHSLLPTKLLRISHIWTLKTSWSLHTCQLHPKISQPKSVIKRDRNPLDILKQERLRILALTSTPTLLWCRRMIRDHQEMLTMGSRILIANISRSWSMESITINRVADLARTLEPLSKLQLTKIAMASPLERITSRTRGSPQERQRKRLTIGLTIEIHQFTRVL